MEANRGMRDRDLNVRVDQCRLRMCRIGWNVDHQRGRGFHFDRQQYCWLNRSRCEQLPTPREQLIRVEAIGQCDCGNRRSRRERLID